METVSLTKSRHCPSEFSFESFEVDSMCDCDLCDDLNDVDHHYHCGCDCDYCYHMYDELGHCDCKECIDVFWYIGSIPLE